MAQINKEKFVCIDCETTGLDIQKDRIIEVAITTFTLSEIIDSFESLIDPECAIPESSTAIHHITSEMIVGKPKIVAVLPTILQMIGKSIIVGHGIKFDVDMVANAAERAGIPCEIQKNQLLDTLRMARSYGQSPVNSLERLRHHFNIPLEGAHRAMSDVIVNIEVFKYLAKPYNSLEKLFEMLSRPIQLKIMPFGPHKGRPFKEVPIEYLKWAASKDFDQDLSFSLRSEIKRRKSGTLFTQQGNPFNEL